MYGVFCTKIRSTPTVFGYRQEQEPPQKINGVTLKRKVAQLGKTFHDVLNEICMSRVAIVWPAQVIRQNPVYAV